MDGARKFYSPSISDLFFALADRHMMHIVVEPPSRKRRIALILEEHYRCQIECGNGKSEWSR